MDSSHDQTTAASVSDCNSLLLAQRETATDAASKQSPDTYPFRCGTEQVKGIPEHKVIFNPSLLEWMERKFRLSSKIYKEQQLLGPYRIRNSTVHVHVDTTTRTWTVVAILDKSLEVYQEKLAALVQLANENRGKIAHTDYARFLIQAAISVGINDKASIVEAVEFAANIEAVKRSIETKTLYDSIPVDFDEAFIRKCLTQGQRPNRGRSLWWVDADKLYHLSCK